MNALSEYNRTQSRPGYIHTGFSKALLKICVPGFPKNEPRARSMLPFFPADRKNERYRNTARMLILLAKRTTFQKFARSGRLEKAAGKPGCFCFIFREFPYSLKQNLSGIKLPLLHTAANGLFDIQVVFFDKSRDR
jgi:hypothetical protein